MTVRDIINLGEYFSEWSTKTHYLIPSYYLITSYMFYKNLSVYTSQTPTGHLRWPLTYILLQLKICIFRWSPANLTLSHTHLPSKTWVYIHEGEWSLGPHISFNIYLLYVNRSKWTLRWSFIHLSWYPHRHSQGHWSFPLHYSLV
jgi:hypothetical protein